MDPLELVRSRNRADVELPSGLGATIGLVRVRDAVTTGLIPLPVLREMDAIAERARSNGKGDKAKVEKALERADPSPEVMVAGTDLRREMVRRTLKRLAPSVSELEGLPEIDMPAEVVAELSQEDFDVLSGYAMRDVPFPAASPST
jgi:hypothetical protein